MTELASAVPVFALLADGAQIEIRPLCPEDAGAVRELHVGMSPENLYLRCFGSGRGLADDIAERLCRPAGPDHGGLGAWLGDELIGVADYELVVGDTAVVLGQPEAVTMRDGAVPSYAFAEGAARAFAHAWSYGRWRARQAGEEPRYADLRTGEARAIVENFLGRCPDGGWLRSAEAMRLLDCYGVPVAPWRWAGSEQEAVRAATELGGHVALKADVPGVVHKTEVGGVQLELLGEGEVRRAYRRLRDRFGAGRTGVMVQRMAAEGAEVLCAVIQEPLFGPMLVFGPVGVATDLPGDRAVRLAPLTDLDAAELVRAAQCAPLLLGHGRRPPVDVAALEDVLLRLSRLVEDRPEIAELHLSPVVARPDGVLAVDARVRVVSRPGWDPYLRRLS